MMALTLSSRHGPLLGTTPNAGLCTYFYVDSFRPSLFFGSGEKRLRRSRDLLRRSPQKRSGILAKGYGTPLPPYQDSVKKPKPVEPSKSRGFEILQSSSYGSPKSLRDYTGPKSYGAPKEYGIPAYSAAIVAADVVTSESIAVELEPELAGRDGGAGKEGGDSGGGGGDGGGDEYNGAGNGEGDEPAKTMSMSQKLTLAYAALVGLGGLMGYAKSGSNKSLLTGGAAALALYLVYMQLPVNPAFASSVGLGISAVLLGIMGSRFKNSGKFMPAGLVTLVSLVMTGGYLHGIVRTAH